MPSVEASSVEARLELVLGDAQGEFRTAPSTFLVADETMHFCTLGGLVLVGVDADGEDIRGLACRLEGAVAGQAAGAEDDVGAAVDHLLRCVAALGRVSERGRVRSRRRYPT